MPEVVIYSTAMCPYCVRAKNLLQRKGVRFEERRIDLDRDLMSEMMQRSRQRTVPQIFVDEHHIGGFDDLAELNTLGRLDTLLGLDGAAMPGDAAHTIDASEDAPT